jgi:DNA-binding transcriptional LysR family regulator
MADIRRARVISRSYWNLADIERLGIRQFGAIANSMEAALALILTGQFVGFLPIHVAAPLVKLGKLRRLMPASLGYRAEVVAITKASAARNPILNVFLALVQEMSSRESSTNRARDGRLQA